MWRKAWLETRWKLALMAIIDAAIVALLVEDGGSPGAWYGRLAAPIAMLPLINAVVLASAGIGTQTSFRPRQTLHPSMLFTLSLPITRRRLVLVREAVGAAATAVLTITVMAVVWFGSAGVRELLSPAQMALYGVSVLGAAAVAYGISAVLAAVLDDLWQTYAALCAVAAILVAIPATRIWTHVLPSPGSPPGEGAAPLLALLAAAACAAALSLISIRLVERRQF